MLCLSCLFVYFFAVPFPLHCSQNPPNLKGIFHESQNISIVCRSQFCNLIFSEIFHESHKICVINIHVNNCRSNYDYCDILTFVWE